jgi:hypothetical protein
LIAVPRTLSVEGLWSEGLPRSNAQRVTLGSWRDDLGLELEAERFERAGRQTGSLSVQYSLTGNAFKDSAALSVGVRDLLRSGSDRRAFFVAATHASGFAQEAHPILKEWQLHAGLGTSGLGGLFGGAEARLARNVRLAIELVSLRWNARLEAPIGLGVSARAELRNTEAFYGLAARLGP